MMYDNVPKIWLAAQESTDDNPVLVPFTYGEALENVPVVPDFSQGDMLVTMPDGYLARSAVAIKPPDLIPENIAEGITIAGILGAFKGAGKELKIASGKAGSSTLAAYVTVEHNLGVIPDLVIVSSGGSFTYSGTDAIILDYAFCMSSTLKTAIGSPIYGMATGRKRISSSSMQVYGGISSPVNANAQSNFTGVWLGNDTTFSFGASGSAKVYGTYYTWTAIAGLI